MSRLTKSKLRALSALCTNFSVVFLASLVLPVFVGGIDLRRWPVLVLGLIATMFAALLSLHFAEKGKL